MQNNEYKRPLAGDIVMFCFFWIISMFSAGIVFGGIAAIFWEFDVMTWPVWYFKTYLIGWHLSAIFLMCIYLGKSSK